MRDRYELRFRERKIEVVDMAVDCSGRTAIAKLPDDQHAGPIDCLVARLNEQEREIQELKRRIG